jgi:hypothetical protein
LSTIWDEHAVASVMGTDASSSTRGGLTASSIASWRTALTRATFAYRCPIAPAARAASSRASWPSWSGFGASRWPSARGPDDPAATTRNQPSSVPFEIDLSGSAMMTEKKGNGSATAQKANAKAAKDGEKNPRKSSAAQAELGKKGGKSKKS